MTSHASSESKCLTDIVYLCVPDYDSPEKRKDTEGSADLSEDTDCDGSSLPDDSPEVQSTIPSNQTSPVLQEWSFIYLNAFSLSRRLGKLSGRRKMLTCH